MKVMQGTIGNIGSGTWSAQAGGWTVRSVLEIGDHELRKIGVPDYLETYLHPGAEARILILKPISGGLFSKPLLVAAEINGKKHKEPVLKILLAKLVLYCVFGVPLFSALLFIPEIVHLANAGTNSPPDALSYALAALPFVFALVAWLAIFLRCLKDYVDFKSF